MTERGLSKAEMEAIGRDLEGLGFRVVYGDSRWADADVWLGMVDGCAWYMALSPDAERLMATITDLTAFSEQEQEAVWQWAIDRVRAETPSAYYH